MVRQSLGGAAKFVQKIAMLRSDQQEKYIFEIMDWFSVMPVRLSLARARLGWTRARRAASSFSVSWPYLAAAGRKMAGWLAAISQNSCRQPGLLACIQGCLHACEWDFQSASQPASQPGARGRQIWPGQ